MAFYFESFEHRRPPDPLPYSLGRELLYQYLATIALALGGWYIVWRWTSSLNYDALWFSIPLALAETCAYFGSILFTINLWMTRDYPRLPPPHYISECVNTPGIPDRPIAVDVFIATYNEDPELVRFSIRDAKRITYPHSIDIRIHVLDDGKRPAMKSVAEEEGVNYITRTNNIGFKAGNLRNAMEQTSGDFLLICDADTRPFPTILEHTLGYFRDPDVAWVQTPQWFYDLPEGRHLADLLQQYLGFAGYWLGRMVEKVFGPIRIGEDPFVNDPQMFYDVIQRRRNWANASFCCGAGSIHRREAVMRAALRAYALQVEKHVHQHTHDIKDEQIRRDFAEMLARQAALDTELTPYKFHVSEDIYTSIVLHSDPDHHWKSVLHPEVESKMLSPQDLHSWMVQRFKYAGGTLDIAFHDNPVFMRGMSIPQRLMYGATIWSYFGGIWNVIFLLSPVIFLFTGIPPVNAYSLEFFAHILPFLFFSEFAMMVGTWGVSGFKGKSNYLAFFPVNLKALWIVLKGEQIKFPTTPKDRQKGNFFHHVIPQFMVIVLTVCGLLFASVQYSLGHTKNLNGLITNTFWGLNNIAAMWGMVMAAFWKPSDES